MLSGTLLRDSIISAANNIALHREEINAINLFPVADCDTGANLYVTLTAARRVMETLPDSCGADEVLRAAANAMLRSSRGNSGAILTLMFRAAAASAAGKAALSAADICDLFNAAAQYAYACVREPAEGTMLTVCRSCGKEASRALAKDPAISSAELFHFLCQSAREALSRTPRQLEILREYSVVDSGALGFCFLLEGIDSVLTGKGIIADTSPDAGLGGTYVFMADNVLHPDVVVPTVAYTMLFTLLPNDAQLSSAVLKAELDALGINVTVQLLGEILRCRIASEFPAKVFAVIQKHGTLTYFRAFSHAVGQKINFPDPTTQPNSPKLLQEDRYLLGGYTFCLEFAVLKDCGSGSDYSGLSEQLGKLGSSVVIVDGDDLVKCHVHTNQPGAVFSLSSLGGYLNDIKIENMRFPSQSGTLGIV